MAQSADRKANQGRSCSWSHCVNRCHHGKSARADRGRPARPACIGILDKMYCQSVYSPWVHSKLGWSGSTLSRVGRYGSITRPHKYHRSSAISQSYRLYPSYTYRQFLYYSALRLWVYARAFAHFFYCVTSSVYNPYRTYISNTSYENICDIRQSSTKFVSN